MLNEYLIEAEDRYRRTGFAWGRDDCVHFAGDWVLKLTGEDPIEEYRGKYSTYQVFFQKNSLDFNPTRSRYWSRSTVRCSMR